MEHSLLTHHAMHALRRLTMSQPVIQGHRPHARTIPSWPPPPAPGSVRPPSRSGTMTRVRPEPPGSRAPAEEEDLPETAVPPSSSPSDVHAGDPLAALVDRLKPLASMRTSWQAATLCASALQEVLRARAVVVRGLDVDTGELRVIGADSASADHLLGMTTAVDPLSAASLQDARHQVVRLKGPSRPATLPSYARRMGVTCSVVLVPVVVAGRPVAVIEVFDPHERFEASGPRLAAHAAERLAISLAVAAARLRGLQRRPTQVEAAARSTAG